MKKIISMLLVLAMMITVLTVGVATTSAAETATITIYGVDGSTQVKEVNVGEEFTVYTTLNVSSSVSNGMVGSVQGTQTYTSGVLSLQDEIGGQYGEFTDLIKVFPVTGEATIANGAQAGKIVYNASNPSTTSGFKFDTDHSLLIVTTYKVTTAGAAEVKNSLKNLAAADEALTKIVFDGQTQQGKSFTGAATFEDPTPELDHAEVRLHNLDGTVMTKNFNIGDTFKVYTTLDASSVNGGKMGSVNGVQKYTSSVLQLNDAVDSDGMISDTAAVFPIMKASAIGNAKTAGQIKYSGSSTSGFLFSSENSQLITTTYKVTKNGYADITNKLIVLAASDEDITRLVFGGETQPGMTYSMPASFYAPGEAPTEGPTDPPSTKLNVTIVNPDNTTVKKTFNAGDTFTVYTVLNAGTTIASLDGTQTYPTASLKLTDAVSGEYNEIVNKSAMFPILGDEVVASAISGSIKFNSSRAAIGGGYAFNTATSKLIVTNYKVLKAGDATIKTTLKTLIKDDAAATKIVFNGTTQSGQSYSMSGTFTDPVNPDQPTEKPTEAPTQPPTQKPTTPADKAVVTIYGIDGTSKTKTYSVGDEFTVYTTFDASKCTAHGIASISASQTFTDSILQSTDEIDEYGVVTDPTAMFPILGANTVAKISEGLNKYNNSTPNVGKGFVFDSETSILLITHYKVIAVGEAEVRNVLTTVAADDASLTKIVNKGVVQPGMVLGGIASFTDPTQPEPPTEAPTEPPTEKPTEKPTEAPTEKPTEKPTEPPVTQKADVTIYGIDGTSETKTYNVGESFTVYTTFDASGAAANGMIAAVNATQSYTASVIETTENTDGQGVVTDTSMMFPVLGDQAVARIFDGKIQYNASTPNIGNGFAFTGNALLIVSHYRVIAGGTAEIRNALITVAAADASLTRIVNHGVVAPGKTIGGIASFTDPSGPVDTYLLGDSDNNTYVESIDATLIQRANAHLKVNVDEAILNRNGDVDGNGFLEVVDATYIQRYLAHLNCKYPVDTYVPVGYQKQPE